MRVFSSFEGCTELREPVVLAAGVFDGVHLGHQAVMSRAKSEAVVFGALPGVLTFSPHPAKILAPESCPAPLCVRSQKMHWIEAAGMRFVLELPFTAGLAATPAAAFLRDLRAAFPGGLCGIAAGETWSFGAGRTGSLDWIEQNFSAREIRVLRVPPVEALGATVSSTRIRAAIAVGNLDEAAACLGRPYSIRGKVLRGAQLGRQLGFPTANLELCGQQLPPPGVYAGRVYFGGKFYAAAVNLGVRPTVEKSSPHLLLEAHLLDFEANLYGEILDVEFVRFLRNERRFSTPDELRGQIAEDVRKVRELSVQP